MARPIDCNNYQMALLKAKNYLGSYNRLAPHLGVTGRAINKWWQNGRPPRTEYTGETNYAELISQACNGQVSEESLLPTLDPKTKP